MPFGELKRFWEAHIVRRRAHTDPAAGFSTNGTDPLVKKAGTFSEMKSMQDPKSVFSRPKNTTPVVKINNSPKGSALDHPSLLASSCDDVKKSMTCCTKEPVSRCAALKTENDNYVVDRSGKKSHDTLGSPTSAILHHKNSIGKAAVPSNLSVKAEERIVIDRELNRIGAEKCAEKSFVLPDHSLADDRDKAAPRFKHSSLKNLFGLRKSLKYSDHNKSDSQLNEVSETLSGAMPPLTYMDTSSAPASVNSSPQRLIKPGSGTRFLLNSNIKFNKIHSFWKMREKKLVKQSVQERRCFHCGCYLNNFFFEEDGALYCESDYWKKYGHACTKCGTMITGPIMIAGLYRFHPECFECICCRKCISDGDLYSFVLYTYEGNSQQSTLFCSCCYQGLLADKMTNEGELEEHLKCTVILVVDFYPMEPRGTHFSKGHETRQSISKGYGLSVKDPPSVLPASAESLSQPAGQIVCGVPLEEDCSLQIGDLLLQVNGLAVDLNAIDLIDRLFDDRNTPLQLTIQREQRMTAEMCLGQNRVCTHQSPQPSPARRTNLDTVSSEFESSGLSFESSGVIHTQPRNSNMTRFTDAEAQVEEFTLKNPAVDSSLENCSSTYCNPFVLPHPNALCCNSNPLSSLSSYAPPNEPTVLSPLQSESGSNPGSESSVTICSHDTTADSGVEEDNSVCENENLQGVVEETSFTRRSTSGFEIDHALSNTVSLAEVGICVPEENVPEETSCDVSSTVQDQCDRNSTSNLSDSSSHFQDRASVNEETIDQNDLISQETQVELPVDVNRKNTLNLHDDMSDCLENSEISTKISPRTMRRAIKKRRHRHVLPQTVQVQTKMEAPVKSATLEPRKEIIYTECARRSNSLRTDISVVTMRKNPSRTRTKLLKSTFSVYNNRNVNGCLDLNRSESMRIHGTEMYGKQRVFRPCDLIHGEVLGQGFFGKAIKVTHRDTGEVMVLKVLNSLEPDLEKSFLKEVKVMRNLYHRNVIHFIGVLYKDKRLSIITEFVECGTLRDMLANMEVDLSWQHRVHIARDISSGMAYLHTRDLIHRDLNSANCFVKKDGAVVVADFGLARTHSASGTLGRKKRYTVVGSPYWMAPEMLNGRIYDERVDIFSFGIVLCEIIGRVEADPDDLPRSNDFGLAVVAFHSKFCESCPAFFFALAVQATSMAPDDRPSFRELEGWFEMLAMREELLRLPDPPNLHNIIVSVYSNYNIPLPPNLFVDPCLPDVSYPPCQLVRSSSVINVRSSNLEKDTEDQDTMFGSNTLPKTKKGYSKGTSFSSTPTVSSRL